jgi:hypothetical protein
VGGVHAWPATQVVAEWQVPPVQTIGLNPVSSKTVVFDGVASAKRSDFTSPMPCTHQVTLVLGAENDWVMSAVTLRAEKVPAGTATDSTPFTVRERVTVEFGAPVCVTVDVLAAVAPAAVFAGKINCGGSKVMVVVTVPSCCNVTIPLCSMDSPDWTKLLIW